MARDYRDCDDASAGCFHFLAAHDLVAGPIAAFHQDIRQQARDQFARSWSIEDHDGIHGFQGGENFSALALRQDGAALAFQLTHTRVAVQPNDQHISQGSRQFQAADMARMEQVKAAVGENDAAAVAFLAAKPQNRFLKCQDC